MSKPLLLRFLFLSVIASCKNEKVTKFPIDYSGFSEKEVVLYGIDPQSGGPDTIGRIFIKTPARLDTFYQWEDRICCTGCGFSKYRFSDNSYPQFAESGFFWTSKTDSVYQFTISHRPFSEAPDSINLKHMIAKDTVLSEALADQLSGPGKIPYLKKEFREINGRGFVISAFISNSGEMTKDTTLYLTAMTRLKKRDLNFIAECGAKDTVGFIDNMYKSLLSIKIQEK